MKDILIIANFVSSIDGDFNSRFTYLADLLKNKNEIELLTSDFGHIEKAHRRENKNPYKFKVTLLHEPGYRKNISLQRFRSHRKWGQNVKKYLLTRKQPDIIYCAVPSLTAAKKTSNYCKKNDVKFIIDVQDLWPEAFQMVFHVPVLSSLVFKPFRSRANKIYKAADEVVAVSQTYLDRVMEVNFKCKNPCVVYLGTDKKYFDQFAITTLDSNSIVKIAYVGTLGYSYDVALIISAIRTLPEEVINQILFIIMGDGPTRNQLEQQAKGLPILFTGRLEYKEMVSQLTQCDIAVNPIVKDAAQSIINKHMDYAMAGLPVVNTQECLEYRQLIEKYECGINCKCGDLESVKEALLKLIQNPELRKTMGLNSRKMGEENFNRAKTYKQLIDMILRTETYE